MNSNRQDKALALEPIRELPDEDLGAMNRTVWAVQEIPGKPREAFLPDSATGRVLHICYDQEHGSGPLSLGLSPDGIMLR